MASVGTIAHISFYTSIVYYLINVVCSDTRLCSCGGEVENFTSETADFAHALLLSLVKDGDLVPSDKDLLRSRDAILCVVGSRNMFGEFATGGQRIGGPQAAGIWKGGERVVLSRDWVWFRNDFWSEETGERVTS